MYRQLLYINIESNSPKQDYFRHFRHIYERIYNKHVL